MTRRGSAPPLPWVFGLVGLGLVIGVWFLRKALAPFFIAMVLGYLLLPLTERLARRMSRPLAVILLLTGFAGLLVLGCLLIQAPLSAQLEHLEQSVPVWKTALQAKALPWLQAHPQIKDAALRAARSLDPLVLLRGLGGAGLGVLSTALQLLSFALVPVILYYILVDGRAILRGALALVPPRHHARAMELLLEVHRRLGGYIRGQVAVCLVMALLQAIGFACLGLPYAWLLGLLAGLSNVVPYSPYCTALPVALLLEGLGGCGASRIAVTILVFVAIQKAEALYFTPVWIGRASKLHPLEVLFAVLAFGFAFGILGLVFAVPLMIVVKVLGGALLDAYKRHPWFLRDTVAADLERP